MAAKSGPSDPSSAITVPVTALFSSVMVPDGGSHFPAA